MLDRRLLLKSLLASYGLISLPFALPFSGAHAAPAGQIVKKIPKSLEVIPPVGMGTWMTFNVGADTELRSARIKVLQAFFDAGGGMIDSSPMYGSSEDVVGFCLDELEYPKSTFTATKVWTPFAKNGLDQMKHSMKLWRIKKFDLLQIHNLVAWEPHLETLQEMKRQGLVRYIGITTSHGRRHGDMEQIMISKDIDFVQLTYNVFDREVEQRLLPAAREHKLAVIANRPFQRGALFNRFEKHPLPEWAGEIGAKSWAQFLLKFILSHSDVTCAIPATSQVVHMRENMEAGTGLLPTPELRKRMISYCASL